MNTKTLHIILIILLFIVGFKQSRELHSNVHELQIQHLNNPQHDDTPPSQNTVELGSCEDLKQDGNYQVLAASVYAGKFNSHFPANSERYRSINIELKLSQPTILILTGYEQNVWHIRESQKGLLKKVVLSGYDDQIAILNDSQAKVFGGKYSSCNGGYYDSQTLDQLNEYSKTYIGQKVDALYLEQATPNLLINDAQVKLLQKQFKERQSKRQTHFLATAPDEAYISLPDGSQGVQKALELGLIRPLTAMDAQILEDTLSQSSNPNHQRVPTMIVVQQQHSKPSFNDHNAYVILKPFQFPAEMYGAHSATFYLAEGVPYPKGELSHSTLYNINDGTCRGTGCGH